MGDNITTPFVILIYVLRKLFNTSETIQRPSRGRWPSHLRSGAIVFVAVFQGYHLKTAVVQAMHRRKSSVHWCKKVEFENTGSWRRSTIVLPFRDTLIFSFHPTASASQKTFHSCTLSLDLLASHNRTSKMALHNSLVRNTRPISMLLRVRSAPGNATTTSEPVDTDRFISYGPKVRPKCLFLVR